MSSRGKKGGRHPHRCPEFELKFRAISNCNPAIVPFSLLSIVPTDEILFLYFTRFSSFDRNERGVVEHATAWDPETEISPA